MSSPVLCLMGPTASGKTDLALALSDSLPCDIISVDSAMIYQGLDIGAAKPPKTVLQRYPHRLINQRDPIDAYSAADFRHDALVEINKILSHQRVPLLVGGTMLYFKVLQQGIADLPAADANTRTHIEQLAQQHGWSYWHDYLTRVDPISAQRIHPNDPQRLQRAIEVYELTGKSLTQHWSAAAHTKPDFHFITIGLTLDRAILHQRIAQRFEQMLEQGLIDEVAKLYAGKHQGLHAELPALKSVGYQQVWQYLAGEYGMDTMRHKAIVATRQLAKRQVTWLRRWPDITLFDALDPDLVTKVLAYINTHIN